MSQPILLHTLDWSPYNNFAQKLSLGAPFVNPISGVLVDPGKVDLSITTGEFLEKIYVTVVKDGDQYGFVNDVLVDLTTGIVALEYNKRNAGIYSVTLNATNHFTKGGGTYRVGLYAQNSAGYWNYEYFLVTVDSKYVKTSSNENVMVAVQTNVPADID